MAQEYSYNHNQSGSGQINIDRLEYEIKKSTLNGFLGHKQRGNFTLCFESEINQTELDQILANHNHNIGIPHPVIWDLATHFSKHKEPQTIDWDKELVSGIKLHPSFTISNTGFLTETIRYKTFNGSSFSDPIVKIVETYTVDDASSSIETAKTVTHRLKEWFYMMSDGAWANTGDELGYKSKQKFYTDVNMIASEGKRRRENIFNRIRVQVGTCLMFNGFAASQAIAEDILISFLQTHKLATGVYFESGRGSIYDDIDADSSTFLQSLVPAIAAGINYVELNAVGETIKDYIIKRLKGIL